MVKLKSITFVFCKEEKQKTHLHILVSFLYHHSRGAGLARVLSAIKVRQGQLVKLVFESPNETSKKVKRTAKVQQAAADARIRAQEKRDELLQELEQDEQRLKKGWFFGLF